jgi:hypothetical protein
VSAHHHGQALLVEVNSSDHVSIVPETWPSIGMAASASATVAFERTRIGRLIGEAGFYTGRPGFWQGSLNVAACWFGGALGLARGVISTLRDTSDVHRWTAFGALMSEIVAMGEALQAAATATDRDPLDQTSQAQVRAFATRQIVYQGATHVLELAAQVGGTHAATHDANQSRRLADLPIYLRQHHPGPDMEALGRMTFARMAHD